MNKLSQVLSEYKALGIADQIDYNKFYLYSIITHSTAIEGSTVTEIENQLLFDQGISAKGRTMVEQLMNLDLKVAYEHGIELAVSHQPVTVERLKELSALVMKNTGSNYSTMAGDFDASKGEIRLINVSAGIGGRSYLNYQKVPAHLDNFCQWLNQRRTQFLGSHDLQAQYQLSFDAHYRLVTIHPWADGNGRMARLLMNLIQIEFGLIPSRIDKEDKAEYIGALVTSREQEDAQHFCNFMMQKHIQNLSWEISIFKESMLQGGQKTEKVDRKGGQKTAELIVALIQADPFITTSRLSQELGINRSAVSKHIRSLKLKNVIRRVGPDKGGHWEVARD